MDQSKIENLVTEASSALVRHRESLPKAGTPLPAVVREAALQLLAAGLTAHKISSLIGVSRASIMKWSQPSRPVRSKNPAEKRTDVIVYPLDKVGSADRLKFSASFSFWRWLTFDVSIGDSAEDQS
jgi:acetyl-CoA acetyltransferase